MPELGPAPLPVRTGAGDRVDDVWRRDGRALLALASVVFEDPQDAEAVVVEVILDACTPPAAAGPSGRAKLARYLYVRWLREQGTGGGGRAQQQRAAVALGLFGQQTYGEIATLMGLPAPEVAGLMRSGLRRAVQQHL
jgi:hypothetical protein